MNNRLKQLRKSLSLSQREFSSKIDIGQSTLAMFETGKRTLKDIHISRICSEFNVNQNWLRYGEGEMFIQPDEFSLDEYAKKKGLTPLEVEIIKNFMDFNPRDREDIFFFFKKMFSKDDNSTTK